MSVPLADSSLPADRDVARYHKVAPWAVAALVLGILSPLAFVAPVMWLLPIMSVVVATVAMRKISSSAGELVGWNTALLGLLLGLLFGVAAPAHTLTRHYWIETRAEIFAKQFIDLLQQGRPQAAYQLTLHPAFRKPLDADLSKEFESEPKVRQKYEAFLQEQPAAILLAQRDQAKIEPLGSRWRSSDGDTDQVAVRYRISHQENGATASLVIELELLRFVDGKTGHEQWRIESANVAE